MLILLDQQVPREMEWLCHGVVAVLGADEAPPRPTQWGRPARAECWGSGATNPGPCPELKPRWACLTDPGRGTRNPDPRGSAAFSKRMGGAAVASCPPPSHPGAQGQVQTREWLGVSQRSAAPGSEGGKTALSRSLEAEADHKLEWNPHHLNFKAAFLFQLVLTAQMCISTDPSQQEQLQGLSTPAPRPCTPDFSGQKEM